MQRKILDGRRKAVGSVMPNHGVDFGHVEVGNLDAMPSKSPPGDRARPLPVHNARRSLKLSQSVAARV